MKSLYLVLLAAVAGVGLYWWRGVRAKGPVAAGQLVAVRPVVGASLGVGTVLVSHSYRLAAYRRGPVRRMFVAAGQHVRKGELLLRFYDHTYLVASTAGIITQQPNSAGADQPGADPVFLFTELTPFRLRLPGSRASALVAAGQKVRVQSTQHPAQLVTGVVLASQLEGPTVLIDLRLQTVGPEPLPTAAHVQVNALPGIENQRTVPAIGLSTLR